MTQVEERRVIRGPHAVMTSLNPHTSSLRKEIHQTGRMAQPVKCLPCKYKDLSSILRTHIKKKKQKTWACNPSSEWVENSKSLGLTVRQPSLIEKFQVSGRP